MALGTESVSIEVTTRAAGKLVAKFVTDLKLALKAGNPVTEALQIANAALQDLVPVLTAVPSMEAEFKENPEAEATTIFLTGRDIVKAVLS